MVSEQLINLLRKNLNQKITPELAADICCAAREMDTLVAPEAKALMAPEQFGIYVLSLEVMGDILNEIKPLHRAHWEETEKSFHGQALDPDYGTILRYERAGRYMLFTARKEGRLVANFSLYVSASLHTQRLTGREDTLYVSPESRKGGLAAKLLDYAERMLASVGVTEIRATVKVDNPAARFFQMVGYKPTDSGLTKNLETQYA